MVKSCRMTKIEAVITVDSKGQILLPKDLRERGNLKAGDKLVAIAGCDEKGDICCIILVKAELVDEGIRNVISPMLKQVFE